MSYGQTAAKGTFVPQNRAKYKGVHNPTYRSSWELVVMQYLDNHPKIIEWYSEMPIPYMSQVKGRMSRYYVDIVVTYDTPNGPMTELIEIKPADMCKPPKKGRGKKAEKTYLTESVRYMNNLEKWTAAKKYAEERGWFFRILTENEIFTG